ncbi:MAG: 50S ribosomal protein L19 [Candidatus Blackburnbacteria bacterium]|nr:50S ribosomal protein L19 [Candidatus Blackburnbacteria bacterium]
MVQYIPMALTITHNERKFSVGDTVRVLLRITEARAKGEKVRVQPFEGMLIGVRGEGVNKSFTVRRAGSGGIGIERIFPLFSPLIEGVELVNHGLVRRSKLYYIREKSQKEIAEIAKGYLRRQSKAKGIRS